MNVAVMGTEWPESTTSAARVMLIRAVNVHAPERGGGTAGERIAAPQDSARLIGEVPR